MSQARHALPARLDLSTAGELAAALRGHTGSDLTLEAGAVTHLGTPGVQVLLAARRSWREAGRALSIADADPGLEEQLGQLGLSLSDLIVEAGEDAGHAAAEGAEPSPAEADPAALPPASERAPESALASPGAAPTGSAPAPGLDEAIPAEPAPAPQPAEDAVPATPAADAPSELTAPDAAEAPADRADPAQAGAPVQDTSHEEE